MINMTKGTCPFCGHNRVIQAWPFEHGDGNSTYNFAVAETRVGIWGKVQQHGCMVAYICQACGFMMWFANDAKEIPSGEEYGTKLIEGPLQGQ